MPERTKVDINYDEDSKIHPDLYLPINWSGRLFSAIEYRTDYFQENGRVEGASIVDSSKDSSYDHTVAKLHILNYQVKDYSFGIGYGTETFDKEQTGFFEYSDGSLYNYINQIDIVYSSLFLRADYTQKERVAWMDFRIGLLLLPSPALKVTQDTTITGASNVSRSGESEEATDAMYEVTFDSKMKTHTFFDCGFDLRYQNLPLQYDLQQTDGTTSSVDVTETIINAALKLYFNVPILGLDPHIGYSTESTASKDNQSGETESRSESAFIFGFDKKF